MYFYTPNCNNVEIEKCQKKNNNNKTTKQNKQKGYEKSGIEID